MNRHPEDIGQIARAGRGTKGRSVAAGAGRGPLAAALAIAVALALPGRARAHLVPLHTSADSGFFHFSRFRGKLLAGTCGFTQGRIHRFDALEFVLEAAFPQTEAVYRLVPGPESAGIMLATRERSGAGTPAGLRRNADGTWMELDFCVSDTASNALGIGGGYALGRFWLGCSPHAASGASGSWERGQTFPESECRAATTLNGDDLFVGTREDQGRGRIYYRSWALLSTDAGRRRTRSGALHSKRDATGGCG